MCGIAGIVTRGGFPVSPAQAIESMTQSLVHRGPDGAGTWVDESAGVALGHRRLSVIDPSPGGAQPMISRSGRFILVLNGEIYNYRELRAELEKVGCAGLPWRGHSDTEVLLAAIETWGLDRALCKSLGMFAFALWDAAERKLSLVRDRIGEKPLYYGWAGEVFLFGSELKALQAYPGFKRVVERHALALLLRHGFIPAPFSIYEGIQKLMPGTILDIQVDDHGAGAPVKLRPYWELAKVAAEGRAHPFPGDEQEAIDRLDALLGTAVGGEMCADVPLGAFLSGGVDSSLIVALMQAHSSKRVRTFTIGFEENGFDEARNAEAVARHLGVDHTTVYLRPEDCLEMAMSLPTIYDEPFADSSQIPTSLLARVARAHLTVSLSGDGADELFGGYSRYQLAPLLWNMNRRFPRRSRALAARMLRSAASVRGVNGLHWVGSAGKRYMRKGFAGDRLRKLARVVSAGTLEELYSGLMMPVLGAGELLIDGSNGHAGGNWSHHPTDARGLMLLDLSGYLPDDILTKVDRAAMSVGLETRIPFLDARVVEFACSLPQSYKIRGKQGKWILNEVLARYVPRQLTARPKMGFSLPLDVWLRGPLREWAEELLSEERLSAGEWFRAGAVRSLWRDHLAGVRNGQRELWSILMFQAWEGGAR